MLTYDMERRGRLPLYDYLCRCIKEDIWNGALGPGEKLPSKRALAEHLHISIMTVEGAYQQLEAEGYVCSVPGKGSFAAPHTGVDQGRRDSLLGRFDTVTAELLYLGVTGEQLTSRVRAMEGGEAQ